MVGRAHKPTALAATPGLAPQPTVTFSPDNTSVTAELPTGESVSVLLYGATVTSWKDSSGDEKLWLSTAAKLDGTKAVRGGIPLVFPVFGPPPSAPHPTANLPQHGFARTSVWEFLGKSTSESTPAEGAKAADDLSVKLDFGLSAASLSAETQKLWPFKFNLIYSVTLNPSTLTTSLVVTNDDDKPFDSQVLLHTYLRVNDISSVSIQGLSNSPYLDKLLSPQAQTSGPSDLTITQETDHVYSTPNGASDPVTVLENGKPRFVVTRDNLAQVVVWNPWTEKAAGMGDFEPKGGYKNMLCVEPGAVGTWQTLEPGDAFEGAQTISIAN
ncbi:galactose mutarotase-like domain-containing protein [Podospora fimiseda]|uniref:Glucose-6-phosphate 1-epimerase n=1 Tax=Podospora fimiseda TaxID=252190 RepID=A0AAN7GYQ8_9PEZI|nr:galactose mutarotase-like domain-containing protein [Podospora fimiseda]